MIRSLLYSLLILIFFAFLLFSGLLGPEQGKIAMKKFSDFMHWRPPKVVSLADETQQSIRHFNESYAKINIYRQMTLERNQKAFEDLEKVYEQTRTSLKQLLFEMGQLPQEQHRELFEIFSRLHIERKELVEEIIRDQLIMVNLNEQMEQLLRAMAQWINEKALASSVPNTLDVMKIQQYQSLKDQLNAFNEEFSGLDAMRVLFMKKSTVFVERLDQSNKELENHFKEILAQVEASLPSQSRDLWEKYQKLETEQRELVDNLRGNEEFITNNHSEIMDGIYKISKTSEYSSDTQMERFRDNFAQMEKRRRELLKSMNQRQEVFLSTRPNIQRMMEDNRYRMETMREQARQISDQYERMEEYRKSATAMLNLMATELKDKNEFTSQQIEDVMETSRDRIQQFLGEMDSAQTRIDDFIKHGSQTLLSDSPSMRQLMDMKEKNSTLLSDIKNNEIQMRALREQVKRDQAAVSQMRADTRRNNAQQSADLKQRTDDQKRIMSEKIEDQLQRVKDQRLNQK